jgi:hypothetical protein
MIDNYSKLISKRSPTSDEDDVSEPRLMSEAGESALSLVGIAQCVCAVRAVEGPGLVYLHSSRIHVREVEPLGFWEIHAERRGLCESNPVITVC